MPDDQSQTRLTGRGRERLAGLIPPRFFAMSDEEQLHALAVAIVATESYPTLRELLLTARTEIRQGLEFKPGLVTLRKQCQRRGVRH